MTDPFGVIIDSLMVSPLSTRVDYWSTRGFSALNIPALERRPDVEGDFGSVRISHDVRRFEIRVSDLTFEPVKGDTINPTGLNIEDQDYVQWKVQSNPRKDRLELVWILDAYKVT